MMKVIYDETDSCNDCLYNNQLYCQELQRPLQEICFERDCPLPTREIVEKYTRYITKKGDTRACGNCQHWTRWAYNKNLETEIGLCNKEEILLFCHCNSPACKNFKGA